MQLPTLSRIDSLGHVTSTLKIEFGVNCRWCSSSNLQTCFAVRLPIEYVICPTKFW